MVDGIGRHRGLQGLEGGKGDGAVKCAAGHAVIGFGLGEKGLLPLGRQRQQVVFHPLQQSVHHTAAELPAIDYIAHGEKVCRKLENARIFLGKCRALGHRDSKLGEQPPQLCLASFRNCQRRTQAVGVAAVAVVHREGIAGGMVGEIGHVVVVVGVGEGNARPLGEGCGKVLAAFFVEGFCPVDHMRPYRVAVCGGLAGIAGALGRIYNPPLQVRWILRVYPVGARLRYMHPGRI